MGGGVGLAEAMDIRPCRESYSGKLKKRNGRNWKHANRKRRHMTRANFLSIRLNPWLILKL